MTDEEFRMQLLLAGFQPDDNLDWYRKGRALIKRRHSPGGVYYSYTSDFLSENAIIQINTDEAMLEALWNS